MAEPPRKPDGGTTAAVPPHVRAQFQGEQTGEFAPPVSPELPRGSAVGKYVILKKLGEGGMGVVYVAHDAELDRRVALKVLRDERQATNAEASARMMREAQAMAKLSHPNVVAIHDVLMLAGQVVMVMELVEGSTLRQWLQARPRSWRELLELFIAAGEGLAAAHEKGLVHRDFKPDNVLVATDGRVRVTDFGIAQVGDTRALPPDQPPSSRAPVSPQSQTLTHQGQVVGTPAYMAPEQALALETNDRSDQFSFALSLYEALWGQRPFEGNDAQERARNALAGRFRPLPGRARVPGWLRKALYRALSGDGAHRYPSMRALLTVLRREPTMRRRRVLAGVASLSAVSVLVALAVNRVEERRLLCTGAANNLVGVWDAPVRERVRTAFLGTALPYAPSAWSLVERTLDSYTREWTTMHQESCEATRLRGEQSEPLMLMRMGCLQMKLQQVSSLTRLYSAADEAVVKRASDSLGGLSPLSACADITALMQRLPLPADPERRAQVENARRLIADARALRATGKVDQSMPLAKEALALARASKHLAVEGEALLMVGWLHQLANAYPDALTALWESFEKALSAGDDDTAMLAASHLGAVTALRREQAEAQRLGAVARALTAKAGTSAEASATVYVNLAAARIFLGEIAEALEDASTGLPIARAGLGEDHPTTLRLATLRASALSRMGKLEEASLALEQVQATSLRVLGPRHPDLPNAATHIAITRFEQGRYADARQWLERAAELYAQDGDALAISSAIVQFNLALLDEVEGRLDLCVAHADRCVSLLSEQKEGERRMGIACAMMRTKLGFWLGERRKAVEELRSARRQWGNLDKQFTATSAITLADVLNEVGEYAEAAKVSEEGLETTGSWRWGRLMLQINLGRAKLGLRRPADALVPLEAARNGFDDAGGKDHPGLAIPLTYLGIAYLELGRDAEALAALERAVVLWGKRAGQWRGRAEAYAALAKSLGSKADPARVAKLSGLARAELAAVEARLPKPAAELFAISR